VSATIETGTGEGYTLVVDADGNAATVTRLAAVEVVRTTGTVGTSSAELLPARPGRQGLLLQNQGANPVHLRFGDAAATASDWLVAAGGEVRMERLAYAGAVQAIAVGGSAAVLALESVV
jgi:hypothetical protein